MRELTTRSESAVSASASTYDQLPHHFNAAAHFVDRALAEGRGARTAIVCEEQTLTYDEVAAAVNRAGHALRALGVRMEQRVALLLPDSPAFAFSFWGAMKIGAVPVPLSTMLTAGDIARLLDDARVEVVVAAATTADAVDEARALCPGVRHVVLDGPPRAGTLSLDELLAAHPVALDPAPTTRDDAAFWLYTSGTTGEPKGVIHLHHDMVVCCEAFGRHVLEIGPADRCFSVAKLFFAYGLGNALYYPFAVGASTVLLPGRPEPEAVFDLVRRTRPTLFFAVPTAYAALLNAADGRENAFASVRRCISAGEPLPKALYERWRARFGLEILDGIGSTEMCQTFISNRAGRVRPGSSGTEVPGYHAKVVDAEGRTLPDGAIGTLMVSGDSAFAGYWNRHDRTRSTLLGEWVRTGDDYMRDADGYFWYVGRSDDMLKAGGIWVSPTEVENVLLEHPAVREAAVVGIPDADELVKPVAFVALHRDHDAAELETALRAHVRERLAHFKCPRAFVVVDALPRTATGKIQRYLLRQGSGSWDQTPPPPPPESFLPSPSTSPFPARRMR